MSSHLAKMDSIIAFSNVRELPLIFEVGQGASCQCGLNLHLTAFQGERTWPLQCNFKNSPHAYSLSILGGGFSLLTDLLDRHIWKVFTLNYLSLHVQIDLSAYMWSRCYGCLSHVCLRKTMIRREQPRYTTQGRWNLLQILGFPKYCVA